MSTTAVARPAPEPEHFDLVIVGSGSGNTIIDERFADRKCAIVDHGTFGGTCLNVGCIPTKMFVYPTELAAEARRLPGLGIDAQVGPGHWGEIRDRIFGRIDPISAGGLRYRRENPNVTVFQETATFWEPGVLKVGKKLLAADQIVLANGSRTKWPDVEGLESAETRVHTSDSIMRLDRLPRSLAILGGGYIAAEFAHVFASLGVRVTVLSRSELMLRREDRDIAERYTQQASRYVDVKLRQRATRVELTQTGVLIDAVDADGVGYEYGAEVVLVATGRVPNSDTLNPGLGGVAVDERGFVVVDEYQRTTAPNVWALGDVCQPEMLKHVANHEARVVQHNLLHPDDPMKANHVAIPHAVFGYPQVASVGLTEAQCVQRGIDYTTATQSFANVAYGWAMEDSGEHVVKIIADPSSTAILGAHIVGPQASTLIQPLIQAMAFGLDAHTMARGQYWIHPALTEVVENALLGLGRRVDPPAE